MNALILTVNAECEKCMFYHFKEKEFDFFQTSGYFVKNTRKDCKVTYEEFLKEALDWNITRDKGWAEVVTEAHFSGQLYRDRLHGMRRISQEDATPEDVRMFMCNNKFAGPYAWIDTKGRVIPVGLGCHDGVASALLGKVDDVEKTHARISGSNKNFEDPMKHVGPDYRSEAMLEAVVNFMYPNGERHWKFIREMKDRRREAEKNQAEDDSTASPQA